MKVDSVDERDSGWEDASPRFRVYLFSGDGPSHSTWTYDITDADVLEALRWAHAEAGPDRMYAVALVRDEVQSDGEEVRGLVWLLGMDANDPPSSDAERARRAAMFRRRGQQVVLGE